MTLRGRWGRSKLSISKPDDFVHTGHGTHDQVTHKLQGLPPEWVQILRENGVISDDLILTKRTKSNGVYSDGLANLSKTSLLSNRSLQKLWRRMSRSERRDGSIDDAASEQSSLILVGESSSTTIGASSKAESPSMPQTDTTASPLDAVPPSIVQSQSPLKSRHSLLKELSADSRDVARIAEDCGLICGHKEYPEIRPNHYEVVDSLGHGSLGVVEEVRVSPQYATFVRKRVHIPYYKRKQYLKIISQEARVLQDLSHCHIVKMIGSYSEVPDSGRQFYSLLMTPVGQRDLKTFLDMLGDKSTFHHPGWYQDRQVWLRTWFKCLSSALAYIHGKGVRHQDIKPSNIIHRRSAIYFTDFSSASQFQIGQTTSTENPARTSTMYAAPEVVDSEDGLSRHGLGTDVFALGSVFTEMLAVLRGTSIDEYHQFLQHPDEGGTEGTVVVRQTLLYGRKLKEIETFFGEDDFFKSCIWKMLRPDRDHRASASAVATQIRNYQPWILRGCACDLIEP